MAVHGFDVESADGTRLRAWTNHPEVLPDDEVGPHAPVVLLCNGLGTNPYAWPGLLADDCTVPVVSWYHRGTGGSGPSSALRALSAFVRRRADAGGGESPDLDVGDLVTALLDDLGHLLLAVLERGSGASRWTGSRAWRP